MNAEGLGQGISIFVPALNEEKALPQTIQSVIEAAASAGNPPFEILIVNDGSTDGTRAVIETLEKLHPFVRSLHHTANLGWGVGFKEAFRMAKFPKITLFPADGFISTETLSEMMKKAYDAEVVCVYLVNKEHRSYFRNLLSSIFTGVYKFTFQLPVRYINATPVYPVETLKKMNLRCERYSFPSEVTVKLLRQGCSFMEIGGKMNPGANKSSALRIKNLVEAVSNYFLLIFEIYFQSRAEYRFKPVRISGKQEKISQSQSG